MQSSCPPTTSTRTHPPILLMTDQGYEVKVFKLTESSKYNNNPTFENVKENMKIYFNQKKQRIISHEEEVKYVLDLNRNQTWESYPAHETVQINIQEVECNATVKDIRLIGLDGFTSASTFEKCIEKALQRFKNNKLPTDRNIFISKQNSKCRFSQDRNNDLVLEKEKDADFFMFCPSSDK